MRNYLQAPVVPNPNQTGGFVGGLVKVRNTIEGIFLGAFSGITLFAVLKLFLSAYVAGAISVVVAIGFLGLGIIGIRGISLSEAVFDKINFENTKCYVNMKIPMPMEREDLVIDYFEKGDEDEED